MALGSHGAEWLLGGAVVVLLGFAARRRAEREAESRAWVKGVRYVLSDAPDAAIDQVTRGLELANEGAPAIDGYFALARLYRRKGELERAIRLHQNLLLRPGLSAEVKLEARFELATDLHRAGLHDKAAESFEQFLAERPGDAEALARLRQVHVDGNRLEAAAEVQLRAVKAGLGGERLAALLLAAAARAALPGDPSKAHALATAATRVAPSCDDGVLALAEVELARGGNEAARELLEGLVARSPESALEVAPRLVAAGLPPGAVVERLRLLTPTHPFVEVARGRLLRGMGEVGQAAESFRAALDLEPGWAVARSEMGRLLMGVSRSAQLAPAYDALLRAQGLPQSVWRCTACGHAAPEPAVRCPRCGGWDLLAKN